MKSFDIHRLLLLLFLCAWDSVHGLCVLEKQNAARCVDLEDARYIDTYHLHALRASSASATLAPGNFANLTSLRHLDLSTGNIDTIETGSFAKLTSLASLNLADNHIAHLEAGAFDGLKQLRTLKLSGNKIRQLPSALMTLKGLRYLDVSDNPLNCNCASMKLRDYLLTHGVKISKKTRCVEPTSAKGMSLLKPDTKTTCVFEAQDMEMQGDQPPEDGVDGSGDEDDGLEDKDFEGEEKDVKQPDENSEVETAAPPELSESSSTTAAADLTQPPEETPTSPESSDSSSTTVDVLVTVGDVTSTEGVASSTTQDTTSEKDEDVDIDAVESTDNKESSTPDTSPRILSESSGDTDDEGSGGETDDEGSGGEVSSMISPPNVPEIDFNDRVNEEQDSTSVAPTTQATPITTDDGWWGVWNALNPFGATESTTAQAPATTEKNPEEQAREEEFIPTRTEPPKAIDEPAIVPRIVAQDESTKKVLDPPASGDSPPEGDAIVGTGDPAPSQESQKGSGSYYVLATLLAILAVLIAFAAYKGDFCKKKRKNGDVERGTEMKDMQKSLLEQNAAAAAPKIQASNGNTMENVPLMNPTSTPEEPRENQKSYDITPNTHTNGSSRPVPEDPIKPPRKGYGEIEAPLNGLNPPMDDIDGPTTLHESDDALPNGDYNGEDATLSPGAQRVKITMGELPESVPKTPILITRLKNGDNLVKTP